MFTKVRRKTRSVHLGALELGGQAPIRVQSMTNTDTRDADATMAQIDRLLAVGCEIIRLAIPDEKAISSFREIRSRTNAPLVVDIHFDHRLALAAIAAGADGVRINPGNVGGVANTITVAEAAEKNNACLRVGVNSGSVEKDLLEKFGGPTPEALVASALNTCGQLDRAGLRNYKVSIKSTGVETNLVANRLFAAESDVPLHIGVTEAGPLIPGVVKSALGIGLLLVEGVGETIRVSLTRDPVEEVKAGYEILRALGLRRRGVELISCPTCGRTEIDLFSLVEQVEQALGHIEEPLQVAVMGCVVNGPGEAREADIGLAGGRGTAILFKGGERLKKVDEKDAVSALVKEIENMMSR